MVHGYVRKRCMVKQKALFPIKLSKYSPFCFANGPVEFLANAEVPLKTAQILNGEQFEFWERKLAENNADGFACGSKLLIGIESPGLKCLYQVEIKI